MRKSTALKKANKLGYTITYHEEEDEVRLRKPGVAVNSLNMPYSYCRIYAIGKSWELQERVEELNL